MGPIASRLFLAFVLIGGHAAPILADDGSSKSALPTSSGSTLPQFISAAVRTNYVEAVNDNTAPADSSRHAAEALSAKFSDITTSSIGKDEKAATPPMKPHVTVTESKDARSIVLAANQPDDPKSVKILTAPHRSKSAKAGHRIPRGARRKNEAARDPSTASASLAMIGQKVGFLYLLTNPALWK